MSSAAAAPRAAVPAPSAPARATTPTSNARAEASRKNGAKSRGPKTPAGKARAAQNALKHGMRAAKYVVLPQEDPAAVAAWRLERADRMEAEVLAFRSYEGADAALALIRDGNGTRSFDTLMRYRTAAMAEFMRALKTLKALQAEQAAQAAQAAQAEQATERPASLPAAPVSRVEPNEPDRAAPRLDYLVPDPPVRGRVLHEPAAPWLPNQHETGPRSVARDSGVRCRTNPKPPGTGAN